MKKAVIAILSVAVSVGIHAQGTFNATGLATAKIVDEAGNGVQGASVQFLAGASADSLSAVGSTTTLPGGLFTAGALTVPGVAGGNTAFIQINASLGDLTGSSAPFQVTLGGGGTPPAPPAQIAAAIGGNIVLAGEVIIPEPTTVALGLIGGAALFLRRRR